MKVGYQESVPPGVKLFSIGCALIGVLIFLLTDTVIGDGSPQERNWQLKQAADRKAMDRITDDMETHIYNRAYVLTKAAEFERVKTDLHLYDSLRTGPIDERARLERFWYGVAGVFGLISAASALLLFLTQPPKSHPSTI